ncbi:hypothetical protein WL53_12885 [Burkholderia ubonensis]|nr:hypothetical protein WL53_12885 [Burkholderia ubonensis]
MIAANDSRSDSPGLVHRDHRQATCISCQWQGRNSRTTFSSLLRVTSNRREALWASVAAVPDRDILADARVDDGTPVLGAPSEGEDIVADYNPMSLTLGRHPLSLLRPVLLDQHLVPAATLMTYRNGRLARGCGIVTVRQRPRTDRKGRDVRYHTGRFIARERTR